MNPSLQPADPQAEIAALKIALEEKNEEIKRLRAQSFLLDNTIHLKAEYVCEFASFSQWCNNAKAWIGRFGEQQRIICIDKNGGYVHQGGDFMHAQKNRLFPIKCYRLIRNTEN